jgi:hypothetical protein
VIALGEDSFWLYFLFLIFEFLDYFTSDPQDGLG